MTINLTIGEIAKQIGINTKTIRYYEDIGLLHPARAQNGYRIFSEQDEHRILFIKRAQKLGFTLSEIGTILQDIQDGLCNSAKSQIKDLINMKLAEIDNQINELIALKGYLSERLTIMENNEVKISKSKKCSCLGENC